MEDQEYHQVVTDDEITITITEYAKYKTGKMTVHGATLSGITDHEGNYYNISNRKLPTEPELLAPGIEVWAKHFVSRAGEAEFREHEFYVRLRREARSVTIRETQVDRFETSRGHDLDSATTIRHIRFAEVGDPT